MIPVIQIKQAFQALSGAELIELQASITSHIQSKAVDVECAKRAIAIAETGECTDCGGKPFKWGKTKQGNQRFRCSVCSKTFSATTGTAIYRLHKRDKWQGYLDKMVSHLPLRAMSAFFDIHVSTAHRWRHRFLSVLVANPTEQLAGVVEADEKFFRISFKGDRGWKRRTPPVPRKARRFGGKTGIRGVSGDLVPVLTALDRSGAVCQSQLPDMKWATIVGEITPWVQAQSVICSDGHLAYPRAAKAIGCDHVDTKNATGANATAMSIGRINAYHRDVENLVNRKCQGVATRYLMNYFGWMRRMAQHKPFGGDLLAEMMAV